MTTLIYLQIPVPEPIPGDPVPVPDPIPRPQPMPDPPPDEEPIMGRHILVIVSGLFSSSLNHSDILYVPSLNLYPLILAKRLT